MKENRPTASLADFLVVCVSPILIMLLVGSLCFFLIELFGRGEAVDSLRWVMFWFVLAIVLVSRIGIEQGIGQATVYGLGLAVAVWLYMTRIFPDWFVLNLGLLAVVWWCANKLVWDCTLIDDTEDASGSGLLQSAPETNVFAPAGKNPSKNPETQASQKKKQPHRPGLWVVYFSLAALPIFGIGQMLLPGGDLDARRNGFAFLFIYMAAAFGLLLVTSFLGLRRYLRQRHLQMPASIALGWVRFGVCVAAFVLIAALLLPRPGAADAWLGLRHQVDYRLHQASDYALRFSPHGSGHGRNGNEPSTPENNPTPKSQPDNQTGSGNSSGDDKSSGSDKSSSPDKSPGSAKSSGPGKSPDSGKSQNPDNQNSGQRQNQNPPQQQPQQPLSSPLTNPFYDWFKWLLICALAVLFVLWIIRQHRLILQALQSIIAAIAEFFRNLFDFRFSFKSAPAEKKSEVRRPFSAFQNPFFTGKEQSWTQGELILYSYDALRAWAADHGIEPRPEQTAREFCLELGQSFPEINSDLNQLSILYIRAAYGMGQLENQNLESLKELWRYFYSGALLVTSPPS